MFAATHGGVNGTLLDVTVTLPRPARIAGVSHRVTETSRHAVFIPEASAAGFDFPSSMNKRNRAFALGDQLEILQDAGVITGYRLPYPDTDDDAEGPSTRSGASRWTWLGRTPPLPCSRRRQRRSLRSP